MVCLCTVLGQLSFPVGLSFDRFSNLVVCDRKNSRLQIFTIGGQHTGLESPWSVVVSTIDQLFVTDMEKHCVHVFQ